MTNNSSNDDDNNHTNNSCNNANNQRVRERATAPRGVLTIRHLFGRNSSHNDTVSDTQDNMLFTWSQTADSETGWGLRGKMIISEGIAYAALTPS